MTFPPNYKNATYLFLLADSYFPDTVAQSDEISLRLEPSYFSGLYTCIIQRHIQYLIYDSMANEIGQYYLCNSH